jgi:hypothetical protein
MGMGKTDSSCRGDHRGGAGFVNRATDAMNQATDGHRRRLLRRALAMLHREADEAAQRCGATVKRLQGRRAALDAVPQGP